MATTRSARLLFGASLCVTASAVGCGQEESHGLLPVEGFVTLDARPLLRGTVTFRPAEGNPTAHHPTGVIDETGHYTIHTRSTPGAPPGRYRVLVFASEEPSHVSGAHPSLPTSLVDPRYNDATRSPLSIEVDAAPAPGSYDLVLHSGPHRP